MKAPARDLPGGGETGYGRAMMLRIDRLDCARAGRVVLQGVCLQVDPGHGVALTGPNGAGKTTVLRTIAGLCPPVAGTISHPPLSVMLAGHGEALKPTLSVAENLHFHAALEGGRDIAPALAAFGLGPLADRMVAQLSAGQRRRTSLARLALSRRPVWALDEPTQALDAEAAKALGRLVSTHLATGGIVLAATHGALPFDAREIDIARFAAAPAADPFLDPVPA